MMIERQTAKDLVCSAREQLLGGYPQGAALRLSKAMRVLAVGQQEILLSRESSGDLEPPERYCELAMGIHDPGELAVAVATAARSLRRVLEKTSHLSGFAALLPR